MIITLCLYGLELRLLHDHVHVCEIIKFIHNISNQVKEVQITIHIAFLNLFRHVHQFPTKEIFFRFPHHAYNKTKPQWKRTSMKHGVLRMFLPKP